MILMALLLISLLSSSPSFAGTRNVHFLGPTADDVNTVRHGMTGLDATAGTADDYTILLTMVEDCADAEVEFRFEPLGGVLLGVCEATLDYIGPLPPPPAGRIHYTMTAPTIPPAPRILVTINSDVEWGIFYDGFESGDTSRWSSSSP